VTGAPAGGGARTGREPGAAVNEYEATAARANRELRDEKLSAALNLITAAQMGDFSPYERPPLTWLDGTGFSEAVGPALVCNTLAAAYVACVVAQTTAGVKCRWLQDAAGWLVVPAALLPHADGT